MSSALEASIFLGRDYSENLRSIKNTGNNLTMKQMFDMTEKLIVGQSEETYGVTHINWEDSLRRQLSLVSDEEVISLSRTQRFAYFRFCVMLRKDERERGRQVDVVQKFITILNFGHN